MVEDKWILSRLNSLIESVTKDLDNYFISDSFLKIQNFVVNDFSRGYIQMTRDREDTKEIIEECLKKISLLLAPFTPYISEYIYQNFSKQSIHFSEWSKADKKKINKKLEEEFGYSLKIIEAGMAERDKLKIGLRWPLPKAVVYFKEKRDIKKLEPVILRQLNVKKIELKKGEEISVELDTSMNPELEAEGYAREISRKVQNFRKKLGFEKKDRINLLIVADKELEKILEKNKDFIKERTGARKLEITKNISDIKNKNKVKEKFKNKIPFSIKDKRGEIIIVTNR